MPAVDIFVKFNLGDNRFLPADIIFSFLKESGNRLLFFMKNLSKKVQKPIDKSLNLCYHIHVGKQKTTNLKHFKNLEDEKDDVHEADGNGLHQQEER